MGVSFLILPIVRDFSKKEEEECRGTIFVAQSLSVKSWPKKSHTMNLFVEYGLKNLVSVSLNGLLHGLREYRNKNEK